MFIIIETAEKYLAARVVAELVEVATEVQDEVNGKTAAIREDAGSYVGTEQEWRAHPAASQTEPVSTEAPALESVQEETVYHLTWSGEIPHLKWMNFYSKVLTRFITDGGVKLTLQMEILLEKGIFRQKIDEARIALRELGLNEDVFLE